MKKIIIILILSFCFSNNLPNDVRWVVKSSEYKNLCYQIYHSAKQSLDEINKKNKYSLHSTFYSDLAIVMDLDETVLDNSQYQIELHEKNETFNMDSWSKWVNREGAKLVPGSKDYIEKVREKNIQLIFISNRMDERLDATKNNLKKLGIYSSRDIYLLRKNKADKKNIRRNEIYNANGRMDKYKQFKVIQYLGDAMGDFPHAFPDKFGISQFIFPNPMYGKW